MGIVIAFALIIGAAAAFSVRGFKYMELKGEARQAMAEENHDEDISVPIIMYHSISEEPDDGEDYLISKAAFEEDMNYLIENGYESVFISDLVSYVEDGVQLPEKPVVITFDDGFLNNMSYAYPFMEERGMKGVISVVGKYVEKAVEEDEHNPGYSNLTWDEITELSQSGTFEIGNHTYDMHTLGERRGCKIKYGETFEEYRNALYDDVYKLQEMIRENCGITPEVFAYPYGFISDESVYILHEMGFKALLSCYEEPNYINRNPACLTILNRYNRSGKYSTEEFMEKALN